MADSVATSASVSHPSRRFHYDLVICSRIVPTHPWPCRLLSWFLFDQSWWGCLSGHGRTVKMMQTEEALLSITARFECFKTSNLVSASIFSKWSYSSNGLWCTVWGVRLWKRFCKMFSESSTGHLAVLQLPCCPNKQGELSAKHFTKPCSQPYAPRLYVNQVSGMWKKKWSLLKRRTYQIPSGSGLNLSNPRPSLFSLPNNKFFLVESVLDLTSSTAINPASDRKST